MKFLLLVALAACASAGYSTVTPLQKVIQMLAKIETEQKDALENDQTTFAKYTNWCDDTITTQKNNNENDNTEIERLEASQNEHNANAADLAEKIAENNANIDRWTKDKAAAQRVRAKERATYMANWKDLSESIAAVGAAMDTLRAETDKDSGSNKMGEDSEETVYESQSGGIREIFEDLQTKFQEDLHGKDTEEREAVAAYDTLMTLLTTKLGEENTMLADNKEARAKNLKDAGYAKGEAERLTQQVADATKYMEETQTTCKTETAAFETREQVAKDELTAIATALELLRNPTTTNAAEENLPGMFAQLRAHSTSPNEKAAAFLNQLSKKIGSSTLAAVAVSAKADVFGKVTSMIKELIARLQKEAASDLTHHTKCLKDLAENEATRTKKMEEVEAHSTETARLKALMEKLAEQIETMTSEKIDMVEEQKRRTEVRGDERAANAKAIQEGEAAEPLVRQAITTLREFYDNLGGGAALITSSTSKVEKTESPTIARTSPAAAGAGGVVSLMEHLAQQLATMVSDTKSLEQQQSSDFEAFVAENEAAVHKKQLAIEDAERQHQDARQDRSDSTADLEASQKQLNTALAEFKDALTPMCIKTASDPQARIEQRKKEIEGLEQAKKILEDGN